MKQIFALLSIGLLLASANASGQLEGTAGDESNLPLGSVRDAATPKVYIIQLRSPSAAEHFATVSKNRSVYASAPDDGATLPRFEKNSAVIQSYTAILEREQEHVLAEAGSDVQKIYSYKYGLNGIAARMTAGQAEKIAHLPNVLNVWEDEVRPLATRHSANFLDLFDSEAGLRSKHALDGEGVIIGVIDSGIAPQHPALQDVRKADRPQLCRSSWAESSFLGKWLCRRYDRLSDVVDYDAVENWNGECEVGEKFDETLCNNKLIGARWFVDGAEGSGQIDANEFRSPRDADGHGTHTATTAAGNRTSASIFGTLIGDVEGMAPRARVAVYKACWLRPSQTRASCNTSDLARAIDAAVADGVDVINYSVGNSMREVTAADDVALMAAAKAGVIAVVAAGNEGPSPATIGSPAGAPWVITAAASSRTGESSVEAMQISTPPSIAGRIATKEALFSPPLSDVDPIEGTLVLVDDGDESLPSGNTGVTSDGCQPLINAADVDGNIALMQRSGCLFTDKVRHAEDAGAIAVVVYSHAGDPIVMFGETNLVDIPALMIGQSDGNLILAELDAENEVSVVLEKSLLLTTADSGNVVATFSARGPGPVPDILKPDVTAPGVNIIAGFTPDPANAAPGQNFAFLSGTSMSTPHIAGVAALLRQAHPNWSPAAIRSALVTTAHQDLTLQGTIETPDPFDRGAGHIVPNDALQPGLVYDVSDDDYDAFACGIESPAVTSGRCDELSAAGHSFFARDLNQPSISVSRLAYQETVSRSVSNLSDDSETFNVEVAAPPGINVAVSPPTLTVAAGATASFDVTSTYESGPMSLWRYGSYTWVGTDHEVRSNIALRPVAISAPTEVSSFGGSGTESFAVDFGYDGTYNPFVHGLNLPFVQDGFVDNDPTKTFSPNLNGNGATGHVLEVGPNQLYLRISLFDEFTDGEDDLDMYVYYCGLDGLWCTPIGESGSPTSEEELNDYQPLEGVYNVYVHGFQTDQVSGGAGAFYQLVYWTIGNVEDRGNMTATGPALVSAGTTSDITIDWSALVSNTIYLGGVSHHTPDGLSELTIVRIRN